MTSNGNGARLLRIALPNKGALSVAASEMLREDINASGPVRMRQVEESQQRIVGIVRRLEESGDLVIQRGTEDVLI